MFMKKFKIFLVSLVLCCALLLCFSACKDPNNDDTQPKVTQYEEFSGILTNVIEKFAPSKDTDVAVAKLAVVGGNANESVGSIQGLAVDNVFESLEAQSGLEENPSFEKDMDNTALRNLLMVLSYVNTLHEVCQVDDVYNVPMRLMPHDYDNGISTSGGYAIVKSQDTHKIMYLYNNDDNKEIVYKIDIDYKSKDNFTTTMIMLAMDGDIKITIEAKETSSYYFFGDTSDRALYMVGNWKEEYNSKVAAYKSGANAKVKSTQNSDIVNECFRNLYSDYSNIDLTVARSAASAEKTFTQEQYDAVLAKLAEEYGLSE